MAPAVAPAVASAAASSAFPRLLAAGLAPFVPDAQSQHRCHRRIAASRRGFGDVDRFCLETLYGFSGSEVEELSRETIARQSVPVIDPSIAGFNAPDTNKPCPAECNECFGRVPECAGCHSREQVVDESGTEFAVEADCLVDGRAFRCRRCSPRIRPMTIWRPEDQPAARRFGTRIPANVPEPPSPIVYVLDGDLIYANLLARCISAPALLRCDACDSAPASEVEPVAPYVQPRGEGPLFNMSAPLSRLPAVLLDQGGALLCRRCSGRYIVVASTRPQLCPPSADGSVWLIMKAEVRWLGVMPALNPPPESITQQEVKQLRMRIDPARSPVMAAAAGMPFASWSWAIPSATEAAARPIVSDDDALWAAASEARRTVGSDCERAFSRDNCRAAIMRVGRGLAGRLFDHVDRERLAAGLVKCAARRSGWHPCTCPEDIDIVNIAPCRCATGSVPTLVEPNEIASVILDAMRVPHENPFVVGHREGV